MEVSTTPYKYTLNNYGFYLRLTHYDNFLMFILDVFYITDLKNKFSKLFIVSHTYWSYFKYYVIHYYSKVFHIVYPIISSSSMPDILKVDLKRLFHSKRNKSCFLIFYDILLKCKQRLTNLTPLTDLFITSSHELPSKSNAVSAYNKGPIYLQKWHWIQVCYEQQKANHCFLWHSCVRYKWITNFMGQFGVLKKTRS